MATALSPCRTRQCLSQVNPDAAKYFMEKLLFQIYDHFDEQQLIDVTFKLSNPSALVTAHRLILSAACPYFNELFKSDEGICPVIEITDIDSDTFERLITFCYTGETLITIENVAQMMKAAMSLELVDVVANCVDFLMEHITDFTLERAYALERDTQCALLSDNILYYELENSMNVVQSTEFLNFEFNKLKTILESDDLNVRNEKNAFEAVKRWYEHDVSARKQQLPELISCLRLNQFTTKFLLHDIQPLPGCHLVAMEALAWVNIPSSRPTVSLRFTNPRKAGADSTILALNTREKTLFQYNKMEDSWQKWADIEIEVDKFEVIFMHDNLIFIGGYRYREAIDEVRCWNLKTQTFQWLPPMTQPRYGHCVVRLNDNIYAFGGLGANGEVLKSVEMYSVSNGWTSITNMTTSRCFSRAVALNGQIYVIGGRSPQFLRSVECFDPTTNRWTQLSDMNETNWKLGVTVHNGQIFAVGGVNTSRVERYDPQRNEWTTICSWEIGYALPGCITIDNQLWFVGGGEGYNRVIAYDVQNDKRILKNDIPLPGNYFCFTVPNSLLESEQI